MAKKKQTRKKHLIKALTLLLPFALLCAGVYFVADYVLKTTLEETAYFSLLVGNGSQGSAAASGDSFVPGEAPAVLNAVPSIAYGSQWARLNVSWEGGGWEIKNVPVYLGADKAILKIGAGMSFASAFPGEGQRTVISSHVTTYFAQLEDTPAGALVTLETSYGPYVYKVTDRVTFDGTDRTYILPSDENGEQLILYTCYPRDNNGHRRTKRCALVCTLAEGKEVSQ